MVSSDTLVENQDSPTCGDDLNNNDFGMEDFETDEDELAVRDDAIAGLENIALSFISQLSRAVKVICREMQNEETQETGFTTPRNMQDQQIVLELTDRREKAHIDDQGVRAPSSFRVGQRRPVQGLWLLAVVDASHEALVNDMPVTKRDVYYRDVQLFAKQAVVNNLVDDLAATMSLTRADLNIRASAKGLFCGSSLMIRLRSGKLQASDTQATLIPAGEDILEYSIKGAIAWVLIVEKDAVFQTLCRAGITCHSEISGSGILITGKGYPDVATRQLVKTLSDNLPISTPILVLVDADPYGLDIAAVYKYGSTAMKHEDHQLAAHRVEWTGVSMHEALRMGVDRDSLIPITIHDQRKAMSMLRGNRNLPPRLRRELMQMLHVRRKAEIEVLSTMPPMTSRALGEGGHAMEIAEGIQSSGAQFTRTAAHPLVQYVVGKINERLNDTS